MKAKVFAAIFFCMMASLSKAQIDSSYTYFKLILRNFKKGDYYFNCNNTIKETFVVSKSDWSEVVILCKIPNSSLPWFEEDNILLDSVALINFQLYRKNQPYFSIKIELDTVQGMLLIAESIGRKDYVRTSLYRIKRDQIEVQFKDLDPGKQVYIRRHICITRRKYGLFQPFI